MLTTSNLLTKAGAHYPLLAVSPRALTGCVQYKMQVITRGGYLMSPNHKGVPVRASEHKL